MNKHTVLLSAKDRETGRMHLDLTTPDDGEWLTMSGVNPEMSEIRR